MRSSRPSNAASNWVRRACHRRLFALLLLATVPCSCAHPRAGEVDRSVSAAAPAFEPDTVAWIQGRLGDLGYYKGPVDGISGAETREAIRRYQRDQGLEPDGYPTTGLKDYIWSNGG